LNQPRSATSILVLISIIVLLIGLGWANYNFAQDNLSGEGFSAQWIGIRSLITAGNSPYSDLVTAEIQAAMQRETSFAPGNPPRYTSPIYAGLVVFPFALIGNKTLAHALWLTVQLIDIFMLMTLGIKLTAWNPSWYIFLLFLLLTIFSYHVVIPWLDGGMSIWAALFLVLGFLAINSDRDEFAGVAFGLSALQPQMIILVLVFTLIWAATRKRKLLILWFFITLIFLSILGLFLVPDWIMQYLRVVYQFTQNFPPGTPGILFKSTWPGLGTQLSWLVSVVSAFILLIEWWLAMRKDFRWYLWTACLTLVISQWIGIPTIPGNFSGLILPLILISALFIERWPRRGQWVGVLLAGILLLWEWALLYSDLLSSQPGMQLNLILPLPLILLLGLYWVRWWALKPRRLLMEELKRVESD
jgi:Glycosyltransferase family 87